MQPPRRSRRSTRPYYSSVAAEEPCSSRGWLSARRRPSKRARPAADGTPLSDEILVGIFAGLPDLADLVRCAGTCRRWRRLVSAEAAFICRGASGRRARGFFLRGLALGFFYTHRRGAAPRFAPTASASRRLGLIRQPSLNALVDGLDDGLFDSSRLVASRGGLLAVELRHQRHVLKLCVCNPMTGEFTVLPPLSGKDSLGDYACTVLTADDATDQRRSSSSSWYRLLIVYRRQAFAACRTYSSDDGAWGPEAKVSVGSVLTANQMTAMTGTGVAVGDTVYWHAKNQVFALRLDTLEARFMDMPRAPHDPVGNAMLGVSPDGRLRALQFMLHLTFPSITVAERSAAVCVTTMGATTDGKWEPDQEVIPVAQWLPPEATHVKLRWVCEKSGVVFFSAGCDDRTSDMYALNLDKKEVEMVAGHQHGGRDPSWCNLHAYEMDQTLYLSSLGTDEDCS